MNSLLSSELGRKFVISAESGVLAPRFFRKEKRWCQAPPTRAERLVIAHADALGHLAKWR